MYIYLCNEWITLAHDHGSLFSADNVCAYVCM
jgi:hypothetical protein